MGGGGGGVLEAVLKWGRGGWQSKKFTLKTWTITSLQSTASDTHTHTHTHSEPRAREREREGQRERA